MSRPFPRQSAFRASRLRPIEDRGLAIARITQQAAEAMGLVPLTRWDTPQAPVPTVHGTMSYYTWCEREIARIRQTSRRWGFHEPITLFIVSRVEAQQREIAIYTSFFPGRDSNGTPRAH